MRPVSWSTDMYWFHYSDINLFLIDLACCKLCNIWLLLFENNSRRYHTTGASHWRKNIVAVITQERVIDENLKRQIKNRTLYAFRLLLLTRIFQFIGNYYWQWVKKELNISTYPVCLSSDVSSLLHSLSRNCFSIFYNSFSLLLQYS